MKMDEVLITNIQRFSLHDGPGIRTTCFLKGCSLRCPWCCNPENLEYGIQTYIKDGIENVYGTFCTPEALYEEVMKDHSFYIGELSDYNINDSAQIEKLPGGVTFSGGEALLQIWQLEPLLKRLNNEHIHTTVETCLFVPKENLELALQYFDLFYVDIKILDTELCKEFLQGNLDLYLQNLSKLISSGKPIVVRIPVIGGYTDSKENRKEIIELLRKCHGILKVELIKGHNLGSSKYRLLGYDVPSHEGVSDEIMEEYKTEIEDAVNCMVEICKI